MVSPAISITGRLGRISHTFSICRLMVRCSVRVKARINAITCSAMLIPVVPRALVSIISLLTNSENISASMPT